MDKSFRECFAELCADRASDAIVSARQKDDEYIEAMDKLKIASNQVSQLLSVENQGLFTQLLDAYSNRQICETRLAYEQGMRDGLRLNKIVGGVA